MDTFIPDEPTAASLLPLPPATFHILLAAADQVRDRGGAALVRDVRHRHARHHLEENAVEVLLSAVYRSYPDAKRQDDTFERAARTIFDVVKSGRGESRLAIAGMVRAAKENRLMVWSSRKDEQRLIGPSYIRCPSASRSAGTPEACQTSCSADHQSRAIGRQSAPTVLAKSGRYGSLPPARCRSSQT